MFLNLFYLTNFKHSSYRYFNAFTVYIIWNLLALNIVSLILNYSYYLYTDKITEQARRLQNIYPITQGTNNKNILDLRKHYSLLI